MTMAPSSGAVMNTRGGPSEEEEMGERHSSTAIATVARDVLAVLCDIPLLPEESAGEGPLWMRQHVEALCPPLFP